MATQLDITLTFVDELRTAVSEFIGHDNVNPYDSETDTVYPSIDYRSDLNDVNYGNGSKDSPVAEVLNDSNEQIALLYQDFQKLHFDLKINEHDLAEVMRIGEAIKDHFDQYEKEWSSFHEDSQEVSVGGSSSDDDPDAEPTVRSDIMTIEVEYWRYARRDGTPIRQITVDYDLVDEEGRSDLRTFVVS